MLAYLVSSFIAVVAVFNVVLRYRAEGINGIFLGAGVFFTVVTVVLFILLLRRNKSQPAIVFLLLGIPAVLAFGLLYPPEQIPDEIWHAYRVFDIGSGGARDMVVPSVFAYHDLPKNYEAFYHALAAPADYGSTITISRHLEQYLNHLYVLPGMVAALGQFLHINPFVVIFMARFTNASLFLAAGYWSLKMIPFGKTILLIYLLNPILIQQEASCSADAFLNAVAILFIAYLLKLRFQERISRLEWLAVCVLAVLTVLSKYAYAPLALLFLLFVPRIRDKKRRKTIYAAVAACMVLGVVFVLFVYSGATYRGAIELIKTPAECAKVLVKSFYESGSFWIESFFGGDLGNLNINVWDPCWWFYAALLISALFNSLGEAFEFSNRERLFVVVLVVAMAIMIILVFREWSIEVDHRYDIITGVQGRYFLPVAILLLLAGLNKRFILKRPNSLVVYSCCLIAVLLISSASIVRFFL